jgi:hypothetical protein
MQQREVQNGTEGAGNISLKISNFIWIPNQNSEKKIKGSDDGA